MNLTGNTFDRIQFTPYGDCGFSGQEIFDSSQIGELIHYDNAHLLDKRLIREQFSAHTVNLVHCTSDIYLKEPEKFMSQIIRIPFRNMEVKPYKNTSDGKLQSVVFMSKYRTGRKGRRVYLTLYDKYAESGNPEYQGILRAEIKICNRKEIREYFGICSTSMDKVLLSNLNPIYLIMNRIMEKIEKKTKGGKLKSYGEARIYESYFREFDFEWCKIETDLKLNGMTRYKIQKTYLLFIKVQEMLDEFDPCEIFKPLLQATKIHNDFNIN